MDQLTADLKRTLEWVKTHRWTRGGLAKRRRAPKHTTSRRVSPFSPLADSFCLLGAALKANDISVTEHRMTDIDDAIHAESGHCAVRYNDFVAKDKRYVIRLLQRIIRKREKHG